jgi:2-methylisocitrate lyase-like PEP mutase family enzyme
VIFANTALRVALKAVQDALGVLRREGSTATLLERMLSWDERQELVGLPGFQALERRLAQPHA